MGIDREILNGKKSEILESLEEARDKLVSARNLSKELKFLRIPGKDNEVPAVDPKAPVTIQDSKV